MTNPEPISCTLTFSHTFSCPANVLFDVWTSHQHFVHWWPDEQAYMYVCESVLAPQGNVLFQQVAPEGYDVWETLTYHEVKEPDSITYTKSFSSPEGEALVLPWMSSFPLEVWHKVTFQEESSATILTIEEAPYRATEAENQTFWFLREAISTVLTNKMERLEQYVASLPWK